LSEEIVRLVTSGSGTSVPEENEVTDKAAEQRLIDGLDLAEVLREAQWAFGWSDAETTEAAKAYRTFLLVCWNYNLEYGKGLAWISKLADEVWHYHLAQKDQYVADCATVFGDGHVLEHRQTLADEGKVTDTDYAAAERAYADLNLPVPADLREQCVWAVVA